MDRCQAKAKAALGRSKEVAVSHLRSKRALDEVLVKRLGSREQLESVVLRIDQARSDVEVCARFLHFISLPASRGDLQASSVCYRILSEEVLPIHPTARAPFLRRI